MNILIGADPELWIIDRKTGKPISAEGLFEGTKAAPHEVENGAVQVDGMAAEFNINPAKDSQEFVYNTLSVLRDLRDLIKKNNPTLDFGFSFSPVAEFGAEYIAAQPEHAKELGCTPDYNAYNNGEANPTPDADMPFRTASGHIHVGWTDGADITDAEHLEACIMFVKQMDIMVGGPMAIIEGVEGAKRRALYGKAGAFRPKPYGVEYRTTSNNWLQTTGLMATVFNVTRNAFRELVDGQRLYEMPYYLNARDSINNLDHNTDFSNWNRKARGSKVTVDNLDQLIFEGQPRPIRAADIRPAGPAIAGGEVPPVIFIDELDDVDIDDIEEFWNPEEDENEDI